MSLILKKIKSFLIYVGICEICGKKHMKFRKHEIYEDVANRITTFLFLRQAVEKGT